MASSGKKTGIITGKHTERANLPPNEACQQYANNASFTEWSALVSPNPFQFTAWGKK